MQTDAATTAPRPTWRRSTALVGRESELGRIDDLLRAAHRSQSGVLVVRGQAGIGKSSLLEAACQRAADMQVLACRGIEAETPLPFAGLHQLVRPVLPVADELPPLQARALRGALGLEATDRPERFLVALAVLGMLAEAAATQPLLCVVDDAHWLDDASAAVLTFVARRLGAEPVVMLFATRDADDAGFDALPQLRLTGLDADAARVLLEHTAPRGISRAVQDRLLVATEGNPLALLELSASLTEAQRAGAEPILAPLPVSARVERAFLSRVRRLPAPTQTLMLVAAVDDSGELTTILDAAARLGVGPAALDAAEEAGLIRVRGVRLELRHPLVRSAIYHGAPLSQRLAAHGALAAVLVGDALADRRAWHRAAASVAPDPGVVEELEQAARRAHDRGAYDAASLALERASALAADDSHRARLLVAAAENAWLPGQVARARTLLKRVRRFAADPALRSDVDRLSGLIELTCGVPAESSQVLVRAARDVAGADAERALYLLSLASWGAAFARDRDAVVAIAEHADTLAVPDTPTNRFLTTRLLGLRDHFAGRFAAAAPRLRATLELADRIAATSPEELADRFSLASPVGLFLCDDRAVLALHRRVAVQARERGAATLLAQTLPWLALGDIWAGNWASASATLDEGLELAAVTGQNPITAHLLAVRSLLAALRGDEDDCRTLAARSLELASARRLVHVTCCATWALTVLELGLSRPDAALRHARRLEPNASVDWDALDRIEAAVRAGERDTARAWLQAFQPWAESSSAPWGIAVAEHCHALLAADDTEADRRFRAALARHEDAPRPFERARTQLAFGELLRRTRRRTEARAHLRAALETFETLGSAAWAERARIELRASGERSRRRDPSTLDELTAQEIQIAHLVAQGGTNRAIAAQLFLSPRTIDFHLRNIFRKLGVTSRTELARLDLPPAAAPG